MHAHMVHRQAHFRESISHRFACDTTLVDTFMFLTVTRSVVGVLTYQHCLVQQTQKIWGHRSRDRIASSRLHTTKDCEHTHKCSGVFDRKNHLQNSFSFSHYKTTTVLRLRRFVFCLANATLLLIDGTEKQRKAYSPKHSIQSEAKHSIYILYVLYAHVQFLCLNSCVCLKDAINLSVCLVRHHQQTIRENLHIIIILAVASWAV